jgi:undecaprenyl-phosphate 4-deoxy-4-formamido-L-arabinose transferase
MNSLTISVIVPVYRSEQTLAELVRRLAAVLTPICPQFEILLVNDGSPDGSWEQIQRLSREYPQVRGFNLMRNFGQHNALLCGIRQARYELCITMDDDLQHPPEQIPRLLEKLAEGYDVVYGIPRRLPHSWWRNLFSLVLKRILAALMGIPRLRDLSAFRAFRTHLRVAFQDYRNANVIIDPLLAWGTSKFATTPVDEKPRPVGSSNYNFARLIHVGMLVMTGFSTTPLRLASWTGFVFTLFGIGVFLYVLGVYFFLGSIPGFPFLASIISLFSGMQLFALGLIGEYLARVFDRSLDRPPYVIAEPPDDPGD